MPTWDDSQYLKFADERTRPARELLSRVPLDDAGYIVDLGCGPGNSTALLKARWPTARVVGVDNSEEMLNRARTDWPELEWIDADALSFEPDGRVDLIFANALLHWLPDHGSLIPRLLEYLRPGGVLAVQMPYNFNEPSHRLMRKAGTPWVGRFDTVRATSPVGAPAFYYDLLAPKARRIDIWQTRYEHVMPDVPSIVEWVKGTGIRPFLAVLSEPEQALYLEQYSQALDVAYPLRADGKRLFSFPRIFIVAVL
jgi:trans-aconitate 2-methyltransferase